MAESGVLGQNGNIHTLLPKVAQDWELLESSRDEDTNDDEFKEIDTVLHHRVKPHF